MSDLLKTFADRDECIFWERIYETAIATGAPGLSAIRFADQAVLARRERGGTVEYG